MIRNGIVENEGNLVRNKTDYKNPTCKKGKKIAKTNVVLLQMESEQIMLQSIE